MNVINFLDLPEESKYIGYPFSEQYDHVRLNQADKLRDLHAQNYQSPVYIFSNMGGWPQWSPQEKTATNYDGLTMHKLNDLCSNLDVIILSGDPHHEVCYKVWCKNFKQPQYIKKFVYVKTSTLHGTRSIVQKKIRIPQSASKLFTLMSSGWHKYRSIMYHALYRNGLLDHAHWSWLGVQNRSIDVVDDVEKSMFKNIPQKYIEGEHKFFWHRNLVIPPAEIQFDSWLDVYNESLWTEGACFFSEKTWKSMLHGRPFICMGQSHAYYYWLRDMGFKMYDEIIDYSLLEHQQYSKRVQGLIDNLHKMKTWSTDEWHKKIELVKPKLEYNFNLAWNMSTDRMPTKELQEGFNNFLYMCPFNANPQMIPVLKKIYG